MTSITLAHRDGTQEADAVIIGQHFGIHESLERRHTLTHIPTGLAIRDNVTFAQARKIARRVACLPLDWGDSDVSAFQAWAKAHPWRMSWALGTLSRRPRAFWARIKARVWSKLEAPATRAKEPIANLLDRREDTCWSQIVMWLYHHDTFIDATPWGFWGPQVARCRRDARVNGSCYCGKFCNRTQALEMGWQPGDSRPIIVTPEMTRLDDERTFMLTERTP
jgi:hypothetical protein